MSSNILTRDEAARRASLIEVISYDVDLDLTAGDTTFECHAVVRFGCREPGVATFCDLTAPAVRSLDLNGRPVELSAFDGHRIWLPDLAADNELRVTAECAYEHTGVGMHRFVDPLDGEAYLYTQFEPFDAHRVFPCFDQPDLKATFAFTVTAPAGWVVVSNCPAEERPEETEPQAGAGTAGRWRFATTPRLSPYVIALVAGPYHSIHGHHDGIDLGLYCRRSLASYLDPDELFEITAQGFDYFHRVFDYRYPLPKYDQLFVPEFNFGAMENPGCVTFREVYVFRSRVTEAARERRAETILHEMSHMWFGDLVTMRWWDDLWLNESFATFMAYLASAEATRFTQAFTTFASRWKAWAYRQDQLPSTHPIVADIPDTDAVHTNFDGITYAKGASVLRQLVAWVGQDRFLAGVAAYFRRHEYANTTLADFLGTLEEASGRDLKAWSAEWLETAGVTTLRPSFEVTAEGDRFAAFHLDQEAPEAWPTLRSHRIGIGLYDRSPEGTEDAEGDGAGAGVRSGRLICRRRVELDALGPRTEVAELVGVHVPDLVLINDGDLAYAKIRLDPRSLATLTHHLTALDDPLARALCWSAAWDMLRDAELPARRYLRLALNNVAGEAQISVVEQLLVQVTTAVAVFGDPANRPSARQVLADTALDALVRAEPGSDFQLVWARTFAAAARSEAHLHQVRGLLDGTFIVEGLDVDIELRWHLVSALAAAGVDDAEELITAEAERDPTDAGLRHAATARAAWPDADSKAATWAQIAEDQTLTLARMEAMMGGFNQPDQEALLAPYVEPYFAVLDHIWDERGPEVALSFAEAMYPTAVGDPAVLARTEAYLAEANPVAPIHRLLMEGADQLARILRTRAADAQASEDESR